MSRFFLKSIYVFITFLNRCLLVPLGYIVTKRKDNYIQVIAMNEHIKLPEMVKESDNFFLYEVYGLFVERNIGKVSHRQQCLNEDKNGRTDYAPMAQYHHRQHSITWPCRCGDVLFLPYHVLCHLFLLVRYHRQQ
jgi:hypothetical protein